MDLLSEDEQWDALKRWLQANGPSILGMVAVALAGLVSARHWWKERQDRQALGRQYAVYHADHGATSTAIRPMRRWPASRTCTRNTRSRLPGCGRPGCGACVRGHQRAG